MPLSIRCLSTSDGEAQVQTGLMQLMDKILHDPRYVNPRTCGSIVYLGSCRILSIKSRFWLQGLRFWGSSRTLAVFCDGLG